MSEGVVIEETLISTFPLLLMRKTKNYSFCTSNDDERFIIDTSKGMAQVFNQFTQRNLAVILEAEVVEAEIEATTIS